VQRTRKRTQTIGLVGAILANLKRLPALGDKGKGLSANKRHLGEQGFSQDSDFKACPRGCGGMGGKETFGRDLHIDSAPGRDLQ